MLLDSPSTAPLTVRPRWTWYQGQFVEGLRLTIQNGRIVRLSDQPELGEIDLGDRLLLPGLVNAHDHLDQSLFLPPPGAPFEDGYAWIAALEADAPRQQAALRVPVVELLFLGGLRNLLSGVTAVVHHGADHRALGDDEFPVRVQRRYEFAHSPGQTLALRRSYRTSDRRIPWFVHAGEGRSARVAGELDALAAALRRLVQDPALGRRQGEAGRTWALARYSLERMVSEYEAVYLRLLGG